jgi:uncharacterized membrane protein
MHSAIIFWFQNFPAELATFLMAAIPVTELRASIPIAIIEYGLSPFWAWFWSVLGNTIMGALVVIVVKPISRRVIDQIGFLRGLWKRYTDRIHRNNAKKFERWGALALVAFVAIPLPVTGAFTGAVAASIFQIPFKKAVPLLFLGCAIAGAIVAGITVFAIQ